MPLIQSTPSLLELCEKSKLLDAERLKERLGDRNLSDDPKEAARQLVQAGLLTRFQAGQLLSGKYKGFFVGTYKVLDQLGKGGMGAVFLCEHTQLQRRVAVKVLPKELADDTAARERFYREARAVAALDHPNIVRVHDVNAHGGVHFMVMEYLEGMDLQELVKSGGAIPYPQAVRYAVEAAEGLAHAHEKGLVHRDVKPANLFVTKKGVVKLLDLGLARKVHDAKDNLTRQLDPGAVLGTIDYLAPEQALDSHDVDHRADIYSLGATLYVLISGAPPFEGNNNQKLLHHQLMEARPLHQVSPATPPGLSEAVARMMAKSPDDRYQTAAEVVAALSPWAAATDTSAMSTQRIGGRSLSMAPTERVPPVVAPSQSAPPKSSLPRSVSSSRLPKPPVPKKAAAVERKRNVRMAIVAGTFGAVIVFATVAWLVLSRSGDKGTTATPARQAAWSNSVAPAGPGIVYRMTARQLRPFVEQKRGKDVLEHTGDGALPEGWMAHCWKPTSVAEFMAAEVGGAPGLGLRNVSGDATGQLVTSLRWPRARTQYTVRLRYFGEPGAQGWAGVRGKDYKAIVEFNLPGTGGQWKALETQFTSPEGEGVDFALQNRATGPDTAVYITDLEFVEVAAPVAAGNLIYRLDVSRAPVFEQHKRGNKEVSREGAGSQPAGWNGHCYKADSLGDFMILDINGVRGFGLRNMEGEISAQLSTTFDGRLKSLPPGTYRLKFHYYGETGAKASAVVRQPGFHAIVKQDIRDTHGAWKQAELRFEVTGELLDFVVGSHANGAGTTAYIAELELWAEAVR
jgi:eukaryotic-like serine/threonine-protein kinase